MSEIKALHEQCVLINSEAQLGVAEAEFWTDDSGALEVRTAGPSNTGIWINWGDGTREWVEHIGAGSDVTTTHTYTLTGVKQLVFSGVLSNVTRFRCRDSSFNGNISQFSNLTSLQSLDLFSSSIVGDIANISGLTSITYVQFGDTSISGDIVAFSGMTSLTNLNSYNNSTTGDIGDLATLTAISNMSIYLTVVGYNTTTLPTWSNATLSLLNNAWTQTEVDNFLIDLDAAGGTNGTLNIAGTNSAPSSAAISAINGLIANGWDLTITTGAELFVDGDMENAGVGDWTPLNSPTLTKEVGDPHGGTQSLRIAYNGTSFPAARQIILTASKIYRFTGWAKGDGTYTPYIRDGGGSTLWTGTSSTSWQEFDLVYVAGSNDPRLYSNASAAGYCEFDDVSIKEVI
jgi:hypothetical protein